MSPRKLKNRPPPTSSAWPTSPPSKTTESKSSTSGTPNNPACTWVTWPSNSPRFSIPKKVPGISITIFTAETQRRREIWKENSLLSAPQRLCGLLQLPNRETLVPPPTPPHLRHRRSHLAPRRRRQRPGRLHRHRHPFPGIIQRRAPPSHS